MAQVLRRQILGGQTLFTAEALDSDWPEGFPGCRGGCTLISDDREVVQRPFDFL
jgi:hypothetical protein